MKSRGTREGLVWSRLLETTLLVAMSAILISPIGVDAQCVTLCETTSSGWNAVVRSVSSQARSVSIRWSPDNVMSTTTYSVQYRLRATLDSYTMQNVTNTSFTITNLTPSSNYEVRVCRPDTDFSAAQCGNCLLCVNTISADEPPNAPREVMPIPQSPTTINVQWREPSVTNGLIVDYLVSYRNTKTDQTFNETTGSGDTRSLLLNGLTPDTTYEISVHSANQFGFGVASDAVNGTTLAINNVPGAFLFGQNGEILAGRLDDTIISDFSSSFGGTIMDLISIGTSITDIGFHFNRTEVYCSLSNGTIQRFSVDVNTMTGGIIMNSATGLETVLTSSDITNIAIDWVSNIGYFLQKSGGQSQIYRFSLDNSTPSPVGMAISGDINSLNVDPIHGFFYWIATNEAVRRIDLSVIEGASPSTNLLSLSHVFVNDSAITAFTLDLADSQYFIRNSSAIIRNNLAGGSEFVTSPVTAPTIPSIISYGGTPIVYAPGAILSYPSGELQALGGRNGITALELLRSVRQPLPVPPEAPGKVTAVVDSNSATIAWSTPVYSSSLFSSTAFSSWTYYLTYRSLSSNSASFTLNTTATNLTLTSLQPSTLYRLTITARGPGGDEQTTKTMVFVTLNESMPPELLLSSNQGLVRTDLEATNPMYVSRGISDDSRGLVHNSLLNITYWVSGTVLYQQRPDGVSPIFSPNSRPNSGVRSLSLDWIGRRLFWVEQASSSSSLQRIYSIDTTLTFPVAHSNAKLFVEDSVTDIEVDALSGLVFWASSDQVKVRTINGLFSYPSLTLMACSPTPSLTPNAKALAVDSIRGYLYILVVTSADITQVYQVSFNRTGFIGSPSCITLSQLSLSNSQAASLAYASNKLYITQFSSTAVYSFASDIATISSSSFVPIISVVRPTIPSLPPEEYRAVYAIFQADQPLPDGLTKEMTGMVRPQLPANPRLGAASTVNTTVIEWTSSPALPYSPIFYLVRYNLRRFNMTMETGSQSVEGSVGTSSVVLVDQTFYTRVVAEVLAYSLWQPASSSVTGEFFSIPRTPSQVQNVRVFSFFPIRGDNTIISAKAVWNRLTGEQAGGMVDSYQITLLNATSGTIVLIPQPGRDPSEGIFNVSGTNAEFIIYSIEEGGELRYLLVPDTEYLINVLAINAGGVGQSSANFSFNTRMPNPPLEVFLVGSTGGGAVTGESANSSSPQPSLSPPLAINTQTSTIYYYDSMSSAIFSSTLDGRTSPQKLADLPVPSSPLAMSYDWIANVLYIAGRSEDRVEIRTVSVVVPMQQSLLHSYSITGNPPSDLEMGISINPFTGFVHWTQYSPTDPSLSALYQLNLRNKAVTKLISSPMSRRRRQTVSLSSIQLTAALVMDPFTERLLVSDGASTDILSCNVSVTPVQCSVIVDHTMLTGAPIDGVVVLPAVRIAVDETRIYWTNNATEGVHYILKSDPPPVNVLTLPGNVSGGIPVSTSPGLQQLPGNGTECLTYDTEFDMRPVPRLVNSTNTTLAVEWDVPSLPTKCFNDVFSVAPYRYRLRVFQANMGMQNNIAENISTYIPQETLMSLQPFTIYRVQVEARNMFTSNRFPDLYGNHIYFQTTEGVPDSISVVNASNFGTRYVLIELVPLRDTTQLRGHIANQTLYIFNSGSLVERRPVPDGSAVIIKVPGLTPDTNYTFEVKVSNLVLNSSISSSNTVTTWPLPPLPMIHNVTNRSLAFSLEFEDKHNVIMSVVVQINQSQVDDINFNTIDNPSNVSGNFTGLSPNTWYQVLVWAYYQDATAGGMVRTGINETSAAMMLTSAGVPNAPNISRSAGNTMLSWTPPQDNGERITKYSVILRSTNSSDITVPVFPSEDSMTTSTDLAEANDVEIGVQYTVTVVAINMIGSSAESNTVIYKHAGPTGLSTAAIIGIAVGGVVGAVLFLLVVFFIICCCYCCCCPGHKSQYTFREDYELNRLRALSAAKHGAQNPHYRIWSREDFNPTDDELDNLNKFPRNRLHLEMFIARGEFGEVYQGSALDILGHGTGATPVAVKTLRKGATTDEQRKFLSEAALMFNFNHPNIVKVLGICVDNDPLYIIMELMPAGDLLGFLREAKTDHGPTLLTHPELMQIALDVSNGCRYLEQQHFIHRDIAARNCLVSSKGADRVVKIGDFGLAKDLYSSDYYQVEGQRKLPVRWMAPEALLQGKFTIESDIWSFGILLWEIMTLGNQPYPGRNNQEVLQFVTGGGRLDRPENCPGKLYRLMQMCWRKYASERPHFSEIVEHIAQYLDHMNNDYSDEDSDAEEGLQRPSRSRTPSLRSGLITLARQGSMKLRSSFKRRSIHRKEENDVTQDEQPYRERGPF